MGVPVVSPDAPCFCKSRTMENQGRKTEEMFKNRLKYQ